MINDLCNGLMSPRLVHVPSIKGDTKFYCQLVVEGIPWHTDNNQPGKEVISVDIGPSTIAYVGETTADLEMICSQLEPVEKEIRLLQWA